MNRDLEDYQNWEKARTSPISNLLKKASPIHFIALALLILAGIYLINNNSSNKTFIYIAIALAVILVFFNKNKIEQKPIPEHIIKIMATKMMSRKIGIEYPWGTTISPVIFCSLRFIGEWGEPFKPWKWEVGFKVKKPFNNEKTVLLSMHPFEGYITRIIEMPTGYTGEESKDLKVLIPQGVQAVKTENAEPSTPR